MRPTRVNPFAVAAGILVLLVAAGCQSDQKPSPKEAATKQWNAARAAVLISLARDQYQSGSFDKCRHTLDEAIKLVPDNPGVHTLSAKLYIEQGQLEAAERELKSSRQLSPNDAESQYLSGVVYQRWQKPEQALLYYRAAADKSPAELSYWLAQAEMLVALDRTTDALALLQGRADYFEHSGAIGDAVGQLLMQLGRYHDAAAAFQQASVLAEDDPAVRERLGLALYMDHDWKGASDILGKVVQLDKFNKRADLFVLLGESQLHAGHPREARISFDSATQLDANSAPAWRGVGRSALESGDLKRAELAITKSIRLDPTIAETHLLLGYVRLKQDRPGDARAEFERAAQLDPKDTVSMCMVGYALQKAGKADEAAGYYARALRIKPGDDLAVQLMAGVDLHE